MEFSFVELNVSIDSTLKVAESLCVSCPAVTYAFSVLAIILMGVFAQFMKTIRMSLETKWYHQSLKSKSCGVCPIGGCCEENNCDQDCTACGQTGNAGSRKRVFMSIPQARRNLIRSMITGELQFGE